MKIFENWNLKRAMRSVFRLLLAAAFIVTVGFADNKRKEAICSGMNILVHDSAGMSFVERSDIMQIVQDRFGEPVGKPLSSINMALLEKLINNNPFVAQAEVFSTVDGKLTIEVIQRNPVLRVINNTDQSFYIDDKGVFMPLSDKYTANVAIVNGSIANTLAERRIRVFTPEESEDTSNHLTQMEKIYALNRYICRDQFWNALIEQIYLNEDQEIELVPRAGNQVILFGDEKNMDEKFDKLLKLYKEGLSRTGWNQYKTINLKYKDQVVCTKK
jgi:cell division protein FtsQ